jgi:RNA polymerase sigma-70 factor (ECF subfamily)
MSKEIDTLIIVNGADLKSAAWKLTNHRESAEDLVQETIYKALINKHRFSIQGNMRAWLYTIMRNIFLNDYRRKRSYQRKLFERYQVRYVNEEAAGYRNLIYNEVEIKEVYKKIGKLPLVFKESFLLYLEGFGYDEIAVILKVPVGTIKSRIFFARKILKAGIERF